VSSRLLTKVFDWPSINRDIRLEKKASEIIDRGVFMIGHQIFLETPRLYLRKPAEEDVQNIYRLNSHPHVMRYIRIPETTEESLRNLDQMIAHGNKHPLLTYFLAHEKASAEFIGILSLTELKKDEAELDIRILPDFWRRGYATELGATLIEYAMSRESFMEIVGFAHPENFASHRVYEKLGMIQKERGRYHGQDSIVYSLRVQIRS